MTTQSERDEAFLESLGWTVECQSPFEIRHTDGSFATGQAATMALMVLKADAASDEELESDRVSAKPVTDLLALIERVEKLQQVAAQLPESDYDRWKRCFELVFNEACSGRIRTLLDQLNLSFSYCDPDMDYEDDVRAYGDALSRLKDEITPFLAALPAEI
jgi:hypothetical protein